MDSSSINGDNGSNTNLPLASAAIASETASLQQMGQWLSSLTPQRQQLLQSTPEYQSLVEAFAKLEERASVMVMEGDPNRSNSDSDGNAITHVKDENYNMKEEAMDIETATVTGQQKTSGPISSSPNNNDNNSAMTIHHSQQQQHTAASFSTNFPSSAWQKLGATTAATTTTNNNNNNHHHNNPNNYHNTALAMDDDVWMRILDYLECASLTQVTATCPRLHQLSHALAEQKTRALRRAASLPHMLQWLRAHEQICGIDVMQQRDESDHGTAPEEAKMNDTIRTRPRRLMHVPIPTLLLPHPVRVTNAGDPDYNGIYFCTGSNGNGFVFSKPITTTPSQSPYQSQQHQQQHGRRRRRQTNAYTPTRRCFLAKRFSNETLLWYASKEVWSTAATSSSDSDNDDDRGLEEEEEEDFEESNENGHGNGHAEDDTVNERRRQQQQLEALLVSSSDDEYHSEDHHHHDGDNSDDNADSASYLRMQDGSPLNTTSSSSVSDAASSNNHHHRRRHRNGQHQQAPQLVQKYSFWARLSSLGDTTSDLCRYPSQSSVLARSSQTLEGGWQTLTPTEHLQPPTVELILPTTTNDSSTVPMDEVL